MAPAGWWLVVQNSKSAQTGEAEKSKKPKATNHSKSKRYHTSQETKSHKATQQRLKCPRVESNHSACAILPERIPCPVGMRGLCTVGAPHQPRCPSLRAHRSSIELRKCHGPGNRTQFCELRSLAIVNNRLVQGEMRGSHRFALTRPAWKMR